MAPTDDNQTQNSMNEDGINPEIAQAIANVRNAWDDESAWDQLEAMADSLNEPGESADLYREALRVSHSKPVFEMIAKRSVSFFEGWFGEEPDTINEVFSQIIEVDSTATWAFHRLTEFMTVRERWDYLFAAYDQLLGQEIPIERRKSLLEEASNIAKDIADSPDKALNYLMTLQELDRENFQRFRTIERMLERQQRWEDLIVLWQGQMPLMEAEESQKTWIQIAECQILKLANLEQAYLEMKQYLEANPGDNAACAQLETILKDDRAELPLKLDTLNVVIDTYDNLNRKEASVQALDTVLAFADPETAVSLHRKAGSRLALMNRDEEAISHYGKLLLFEPGDADALKNLRILSVRAKKPELRAAALVKAAEAAKDDGLKVTHLLDAARIYADDLNEHSAAIGILKSILEIPDVDPTTGLLVSHKLNELFASEGRKEERLSVLEHISDLEKTHALRRTVIVEAARLADDLGDTKRALSLWQTLLETTPDDREAIGAVIDLLERLEDYAGLADNLERRAGMSVPAEQRRLDLVRSARVCREHLEDPVRSATLWKSVFDEFGPRDDAIAALDELLTDANQFEDLDQLLSRAVTGEFARMKSLFLRRADINATALKQLEQAFELYHHVLLIEPDSQRSIEGIQTLMSHPPLTKRAVDALVTAHRTTDDWLRLLELTSQRIETAKDEAAQIPIYLEAADLQKNRADNPEAARDLLTRVLPLDPENQKIEAEMMRLAKKHGGWNRTGLALGHAASALFDNPKRRAHLKYLEGQVLENELKKDEAALAAYTEVASLDQRNTDALKTICIVATRLLKWAEASDALLKLAILEDAINTDFLEALCQTAKGNQEMQAMVDALAAAVSKQRRLRATLRRQLETAIARYYAEDCDAMEAAENAAARAVAADPNHLASLALLADIQRKNDSQGLIQTLERIYDLKDNNLDPLMEAAQTAMSMLSDASEKRTHLLRLHEASSSMWRLGKRAVGEHSIESCCHFATWEIVKLDEERGMWERAAELLIVSSSLRFAANQSREMLLKAAALYSENGMNASAIKVYMTAWQQNREDEEVLWELNRLLDAEHRYSDLIGVKTKLLQLIDDHDKKMELRLDNARLAGILEGSDERIDMLKANLVDEPGHAASIHRLSALMRQRQMFDALAALYTEQSVQLANRSDNQRAATLLLQAAKVYEEKIEDVDRAVDTYERVIDLDAIPSAMDALARLHASQNRLPHTVSWLQRRLTIAKPHERVSVLLRLARTQLKIDKRNDAVSTLEQAFDEAPKHPEIRTLLLNEYRSLENYDALANALSRAAQFLSNPSTVLAYSTEAADLYFEKLHVRSKAVTVLERAVELSPDEKRFQLMLAEALAADEQFERAEEILQELLEGFGRRRSKERGAIHLQLANVAKAKGDLDESAAQLELATSMDTHNVDALKTLAELNREKGDLERAEKVYRSLLLLVRRESPKEGESPVITPGEILFELSFLASERDQSDKAQEIEESAFEALTANTAEIDRIKVRMLAKEKHALLARVYEHFLSFVDNPTLKARVRSQLADVLSGPLDRGAEALDMRLTAVSEDPRSPDLHDAAEAACQEQGQYDKYVSLVQRLIEETRREGDELKRCELLIRLANIHTTRDDLDEAWKMFQMADALGVREVAVLKLGIKLTRARGDRQAEVEMLSKLSNLGEEDVASQTRADALYSLAEIHIAADETFDEGVSMFDQAFSESPNCARAGRILIRACRQKGPEKRLMRIFEKVSRESEDQTLKLEYLELKATLPEARAAEIKEGAQLAISLDESERAEAMMRRMLEAREVEPEDKAAVSWAILTLADQRKNAGDLSGALNWLNEASEIATSPEIFEIGLEIGALAKENGADEDLAVKVYKWLLVFDPSNRKAWEPLSELYTKKQDIEGFEGLVQESLYTIEDPAARNTLRLNWAKLLLSTKSRLDEAQEVLKNIQLDEPSHKESLSLLAQTYIESDKQDELVEYLEYRFESAQTDENADEMKAIALVLGPQKRKEDRTEAVAIYRTALGRCPKDKELIERLIVELDEETHAEEILSLKEQLLYSEPEETIAAAAMETAKAYQKLEDEASVLRVLKYAYLRAPENKELQGILEKAYRDRGDFRGLVELLVKQCERIESPEDKATALMEIAEIAKNELNDLPKEIEALKEATVYAPNEMDTVLRLLLALSDANRFEEAMETASAALERFTDRDQRATFLNFRGNLLRSAGDLENSLADLSNAFELAPNVAAENLRQALTALVSLAKSEGDLEAEQKHMKQLITVLEMMRLSDEVRSLLIDWLERTPDDVVAWRQLLNQESNAERWMEVATISERLIDLTTGDEQIRAALRMSTAYDLTEEPAKARFGLEQVQQAHPENEEIREALKSIYQKTGALMEFASMLLIDAETMDNDSERAKTLKRAGFCLAEGGNTEDALEALQKAIAVTPEDFELSITLIDLHLDRGALDEANDLADKAIQDQGGRRSKELGLLQYRKATIMGAYGDTSQELSWLEQAFLSNRNDGNIAVQLADLAEQMEEWDVAQKALRQIAVLKEDLPMSRADALLRQAKIVYYHEDDKKRGVLYARKAVQQEPDNEEAKAFLAEITED